MFKRPRSHKESVLAFQSKNKRMKEDCSSMQERQRPARENYVNVTYPNSNTSESPENALQDQRAAVAMDTEEGRTNSTRYNRLKLQQKGGVDCYESHVRSCVNQCYSSETSSTTSEVTEAPESRERDHYNKLKVDMKQAQSNKKLQRGVKVLHAQDSTTGLTSVNKTSGPIAPHCSTKVASAGPFQSHNSPMKYRKEGHANQLHSVSGTFHSVRKPTKPSSLLPKSKSTGDIMRLSNDGVAHVSHNIRRHHLTHSRSTHNIESATETSDSYSTGGATRVSHSPSSSADEAHHHMLGHTPASAPHHQTPISSELPFINKMITFTCTHEGREIKSTAYDFSVKISKRTVRKRKSIGFNIGVCLHGPFSFPTGYRLVSPVLMVTSPIHSKLKKPIEVILSHCTDLASQVDKNGAITFFRARKARGNSSPQNYQFEPTDVANNHFEVHNNHGKLSSMELGFFCIMAKEMAETRRKTNYCLVPVVPRHTESSSWKVHYCVTLHLQAFVNEIGNHFGPNWEMLAPKPFKLETRVGAQNQEKIEINFQRILPECGWTLSLKTDSKIPISNIDSWANKWTREGTAQLYPPRFTIRVCGDFATSSAVAPVWFTGPGMCQDLAAEVNLSLKCTPPSSVPSPNPAESTLSSFSSTSILLSSAMGSILSTSDYDHLPSREELDMTHIQLTYHNGHIDFPTDDDLETVSYEVVRTTGKDWAKLQTSLDIPQYVMADILNQRTIHQQIFRLLKEWRQHSKDSSKKELARCLRRADPQFSKAAAILLKH